MLCHRCAAAAAAAAAAASLSLWIIASRKILLHGHSPEEESGMQMLRYRCAAAAAASLSLWIIASRKNSPAL
jgi:hypothetical protein